MGNLNSGFFLAALAIVLIDVVLAGDNAVVISMAVKSLPQEQRRTGVVVGALGAVVLRVILTSFAARMLQMEFLKLVGGGLIFWIAVRLLAVGAGGGEKVESAQSLRQAIWVILVADVTMSLDNILAVAAVAKDNRLLLIAGLGLSIPFVVFTSSLLSRVMDRYPVLIWIGAAILGRVAGGMMVTDPWIKRVLRPSEQIAVVGEVCGAGLVLGVGWWMRRRKAARKKDKVEG